MSDEFEKKSGKKVGIIAIIVVLIAAIVGGICYLGLGNKPDQIFEKAISDAFEMAEKNNQKSAKVDLEITAAVDGKDAQVQMINSILKDIKLKVLAEMDLNKKIMNSNVIATYNDNQIIDATALIQDEEMYFYLKDLYDKYIKINKEYLENAEVDLQTIFDVEDIEPEKLSKDIEKIILDKIREKEIKQEKVELNGENVQKTTVKLTAKDMLELAKAIIEKVNEYKPTEEFKDTIEELEDEIEYVEDEDAYVEISIYSKGIKNEIVKAEIEYIVDEYMACVIDIDKKSENETVITISMNEEDSDVEKAEEVATITINKEDKNNGTIKLQAEIEGVTATLTVKYSVDYNAKVEAQDVSNSILVTDITEEEANKILENIQNNEFLSSLIGNF